MFQATRRAFLAACGAVASLIIPDREAKAKQGHGFKYACLNDWFDWLDYQYTSSHEYNGRLNAAVAQLIHLVEPKATSFTEQVEEMLRRRKTDPTRWGAKPFQVPTVATYQEFCQTQPNPPLSMHTAYMTYAWGAIRNMLMYGNAFVTPYRGQLKLFAPREIELAYDPLPGTTLIVWRPYWGTTYDMTDFCTHVKLGGAIAGVQSKGWCLPPWVPEQPMPTVEKLVELGLASYGLQQIRRAIAKGVWLDQVHAGIVKATNLDHLEPFKIKTV